MKTPSGQAFFLTLNMTTDLTMYVLEPGMEVFYPFFMWPEEPEPIKLDKKMQMRMIYLKKEISRMSATLLFDQNVQRTWLRFTSQAVPFLENVKAGLGITEFRFLLDKTTTTPDLIDRNIMYAKIIVKPARAIEYIALDFVITNSGASFND